MGRKKGSTQKTPPMGKDIFINKEKAPELKGEKNPAEMLRKAAKRNPDPERAFGGKDI